MIAASTIDAMIDAGASAQVIAAAWKAEIAQQEMATAERRANDRERQRRHRVSRDVTVTNAESADIGGVSPHEVNNLPPHPEPQPAKAGSPLARGARLPDDFSLPDDWRAWATAERKWDRSAIEAEAASFADFWHAKPGKDGRKLDWLATWRNWVRNSRRPNGNSNGSRPMNADEIRSSIRYAEDHDDPDRAADLKRQLADLLGKSRDPKIAQLIQGAVKQLKPPDQRRHA